MENKLVNGEILIRANVEKSSNGHQLTAPCRTTPKNPLDNKRSAKSRADIPVVWICPDHWSH